MKRQKRSQLEILGLAIVVILITLGMLFVIKFVVLKKPSDLKQSYMATELASNTLNTLLRTNTDCKSKTITELIQDSAMNPPDGSIDCGGRKSRIYVDETINLILSKTLKEIGKKYYFIVELGDGTKLIELEYEGCPGEKESKPFYIPLQTTVINLRLDLCN